MVEAQHVWVERDGRTLLENVDFVLDRGEFAYVLGSTGAGKTTLLRLLRFEERPTRGVVFVGEYDSSTILDRDVPHVRRRIGVVFQDHRLLRDRSVYENVAFALSVTGTPGNEVKRRTLSLLSYVDLLHKRAEYPTTLSGGECQRVAIARALVNDPFVLLADEPTANLDSEATERVLELFQEVNDRGTAVLMATHDLSVVERHPRRGIHLPSGRVVPSVAEGV